MNKGLFVALLIAIAAPLVIAAGAAFAEPTPIIVDGVCILFCKS